MFNESHFYLAGSRGKSLFQCFTSLVGAGRGVCLSARPIYSLTGLTNVMLRRVTLHSWGGNKWSFRVIACREVILMLIGLLGLSRRAKENDCILPKMSICDSFN